jgi:hypothetical protein
MIENTSPNAPELDSGGVGIPSEKRCAEVRFREASSERSGITVDEQDVALIRDPFDSKLSERLSSLHTFVASRSHGGALPLATSDHIHCVCIFMLEEARAG